MSFKKVRTVYFNTTKLILLLVILSACSEFGSGDTIDDVLFNQIKLFNIIVCNKTLQNNLHLKMIAMKNNIKTNDMNKFYDNEINDISKAEASAITLALGESCNKIVFIHKDEDPELFIKNIQVDSSSSTQLKIYDILNKNSGIIGDKLALFFGRLGR